MRDAVRSGRNLRRHIGRAKFLTEGVATAPALVRLAQKHNVDMPISLAVNRVLNGEATPQQAMIALLARPLKSEAG